MTHRRTDHWDDDLLRFHCDQVHSNQAVLNRGKTMLHEYPPRLTNDNL